MQFVERLPWVPQFNIQYFVGVDGLSLFLVLLTTFLTMLVLLFSWEGVEKRLKTFLVLMLVLEAGHDRRLRRARPRALLRLLGADPDPDVLPDRRLGRPARHVCRSSAGTIPWRIYAALKFFIYTMAGSALMLVAILVLYFQRRHLRPAGAAARSSWRRTCKSGCSLAFALAFAIKVPLFPFHTWLPDAHVAAPTGGSVILAAASC